MKNMIISMLACVFAASLSHAAVLGVTDITISPTTDPIDNTATLQDFTNSSGTFTLTGTTDVSNSSTLSSSDGYRNFWGSAGTEIDGSASLEGLDLGHGVLELVQADFQFGQLIGDGDTTNGNDIVLFEVGSLDSGTTIQPLNSSGNVIGDFTVTFGTGSWSDTGTDIDITIDNPITGTFNVTSPVDVNGLGFDLSDFSGTGSLTGVTGFRITSSVGGGAGSDTLDLAVAGTVIPEPSTLLLTGLSLVAGLLLTRRRG